MEPLAELSRFAHLISTRIREGSDFADFDALALRLHRLQLDAIPDLRRLVQAAPASLPSSPHATLSTLSSLWQIPAVPTIAFQELDLSAWPPSQRSTFFQSSGTTGTRRSRQFHAPDSLALYDASALAWFAPNVLQLPPASAAQARAFAFLSLTPPAAQAPHSSLVHMLDRVGQEFGAEPTRFLGHSLPDASWELPADLPERLAQAIRQAHTQRRPMILMGTAFNFVHLLDAISPSLPDLPSPRSAQSPAPPRTPSPAKPGAFHLPHGSRIMETGGYKGRSRTLPREDLHAALAHLFGVQPPQVLTEYGMCELSSQAYATTEPSFSPAFTPPIHPHSPNPTQTGSPSSALLRFPPWARAGVLSPETGRPAAPGEPGEPGLLRIWDLANVWSACCLQTADLAIDHGRGFELLGRQPGAIARGCSLMSAPRR